MAASVPIFKNLSGRQGKARIPIPPRLAIDGQRVKSYSTGLNSRVFKEDKTESDRRPATGGSVTIGESFAQHSSCVFRCPPFAATTPFPMRGEVSYDLSREPR